MQTISPPAFYVIDLFDHAYDRASYDKPIAVLTGPEAFSSGDQVALRMTFHPRARTFGLSTATAFSAPSQLDLDPEWFFAFAEFDAFAVTNRHEHLTHDEFPVERPIWLRPADVAVGRDSVVEAAVDWIKLQAP